MNVFRGKVRELAKEIVSQFKARGGGDFKKEVSYALLTKVILSFLALSEDLGLDLKSLIGAMMKGFEVGLSADEWKVTDDAADVIRDFWGNEVRRRAANPTGTDMISELLRRSGFRPDEIIVIAENIFAAAFDTTANTSANGFFTLLHNTEQMERARRDRALRTAIPTEVLRVASAAPFTARITDAPTLIGDVKVPAGSTIVIAVGAANRDPDAFKDPDRFYLGRSEAPPVSFGYGLHACLGRVMAGMVLGELYDEILDQWDRIELVGEDPHFQGLFLRHLDELHVRVN